jgi:hypothetical protein
VYIEDGGTVNTYKGFIDWIAIGGVSVGE